jgi:hypothetical protein
LDALSNGEEHWSTVAGIHIVEEELEVAAAEELVVVS